MADGLVDIVVLNKDPNPPLAPTTKLGSWELLSFQDHVAIEIPSIQSNGINNNENNNQGQIGKKMKLYSDIKYSFDYVLPAEEIDPMLFFETTGEEEGDCMDDENDNDDINEQYGFDGGSGDRVGQFNALRFVAKPEQIDRNTYGNNVDSLFGSNNVSKPRPKSAGSIYNARRRPSSSNQSNATNTHTQRGIIQSSNSSKLRNGSAQHTLSVQGVKCSMNHMHFIDSCCEAIEKTDLLQRWARHVIVRARLYHKHRKSSAIILQCSFRLWSAKRRKCRIISDNMATKIQCLIRRFVSKQKRIFLLKSRCAMKIQCHIRCWLACRLRHWFHCLQNGIVVLRWYRKRIDIRRRKAAYKIVRFEYYLLLKKSISLLKN